MGLFDVNSLLPEAMGPSGLLVWVCQEVYPARSAAVMLMTSPDQLRAAVTNPRTPALPPSSSSQDTNQVMDRMQQLEVRMMLMNFYAMQVGSTPGQMLCHWCNSP